MGAGDGGGTVWMWQQRQALPRITFVEVAMVLYILWCYSSMVLPHQYPPLALPPSGAQDKVSSFIEERRRVIPVHDVPAGEAAVRPGIDGAVHVWSILRLAVYSPMVRIFEYSHRVVGPRYIVRAPNAPGRAVGVFNEPVGNGMVLIIGFVVAIMLASDRGEPAWRRPCSGCTR